MKKTLLFTIFFYLFFSLVLVQKISFRFVYAETPTPTVADTPTPTPSNSSQQNSRLNDIQNEIKDLQNKVSDLQNQGKTLASQIGVMDNQIKLTQLKIRSTEQEIADLTEDINTTNKKITSLEGALSNLTKVLVKRVVVTYQVGSIEPLSVLAKSGGMAEFLTKVNYLGIAQAHDKELLIETQQAKNDYANQKSIFEEKKKKVETLKAQLDEYTKQLDADKKNKENLLSVTRNSESEYQKRLADALRELRQIQKAAKVLIATEPRKVSKGEPIGLMGNTGYSFGAHLHFGVYNIASLDQYDYYSGHENPASVLEPRSIDWQTGCSQDGQMGTRTVGGGSFGWPMSTDNFYISQGYGQTCYSNVYYRGNPHPAFDMVSKGSIIVSAVEEGQAYFCKNCTGDGANGVFIFHPNGKMSLYWHLQ